MGSFFFPRASPSFRHVRFAPSGEGVGREGGMHWHVSVGDGSERVPLRCTGGLVGAAGGILGAL